MVIDYRKFKTPYFKIEVGPNNQALQELPMQVLKLVDKIEISEFIGGCVNNQLKISFIEGSREPAAATNENASNFYSGGQFTNSTGMIVDLKQVNTSGGVILTALPTASAGAAATAFSSGTATASGSIEQQDAVEIINTKSPQFVFSPRNRIKITWGYLEDPETLRVFSGRIMLIRTDFPENGHPVTEVIAHGPTAEFDQLVPEKGITFGLNSFGGEIEDMTIGQVLDQIGVTGGFDIIRSQEFTAEKVNNGVKTWVAGQSLNEFLARLAKRHHAYYTAIENGLTGKPTIVFIRQVEFNQTTLVPDYLMTYRQPGSILKSVNITADFGSVVGKSNVGIDDSGNNVKGKSTQGLEEINVFEGADVLDTNPSTGSTASPAGQGVAALGENVNGNVEYSAESNDPSSVGAQATSVAGCGGGGVVMLEFSTLGYTKIKPGSCPFKGIGKRYSGYYQIIQVSHIIDSNGYLCRGAAKGSNSGGGEGITPPGANSTPLTQSSETIKLYHEATNTSTASGGNASAATLMPLD